MTRVVKNELGNRYGRLVVTAQVPKVKDKPAAWACTCDCGSTCEVIGPSLRNGNTKSCGCLRREIATKRGKNQTHGRSKTPEYRSWRSMWSRCTNQKNSAYVKYGGRGIAVIETWKTFENFFLDMGQRPSLRHSIDRIDNSQGYFKGNCRWATHKEQNRNRSSNHFLTLNGVRKVIVEWSETTGIPKSVILSRIQSGWTVEKALTQPCRYKRPSITREDT